MSGVGRATHRRGQVQVHHVAKLADLAPPGRGQPALAKAMAAKRRETLVVCTP
jgi:hypothetical protein